MKKNQSGRSMVEMLGVLAIIGVLSVGAIAGYSKAMFKYKMNKTLDIISQVTTRIAELDLNLITHSDDDIYINPADYNICPRNDGYGCSLPLGSISFDLAANKKIGILGGLYIGFYEEPYDSCVAFMTSEIYKNVPENWWPTKGKYVGHLVVGNLVYSKSVDEIMSNHTQKSELTNEDIITACETACKNKSSCTISWIIKENT